MTPENQKIFISRLINEFDSRYNSNTYTLVQRTIDTENQNVLTLEGEAVPVFNNLGNTTLLFSLNSSISIESPFGELDLEIKLLDNKIRKVFDGAQHTKLVKLQDIDKNGLYLLKSGVITDPIVQQTPEQITESEEHWHLYRLDTPPLESLPIATVDQLLPKITELNVFIFVDDNDSDVYEEGERLLGDIKVYLTEYGSSDSLEYVTTEGEPLHIGGLHGGIYTIEIDRSNFPETDSSYTEYSSVSSQEFTLLEGENKDIFFRVYESFRK